jgi:light-regulated signal transduction histidine kinase (bacteriophytochrome)
MKLGPKLTLLFWVLSLIPLVILGISAYQTARRALERDTFKHLSSVTLLKEADLNRWVFFVRDNGIEPAYFEHSFVIFWRLHGKETYPNLNPYIAVVQPVDHFWLSTVELPPE